MEEVPLLKQLQTNYAKRATIIGISSDITIPRVDEVVKEKGMTWPILADGKGLEGPIPVAYHVQGTPDLFVIDKAGKIVKRLGSATEIDAALAALIDPGR